MFKRYSVFTPTLGQSWILVVFFTLVGSFFSGIIVFPLIRLFPGNELISKALQYLLMFVPLLFYINFQSKRIEKDAFISGQTVEKVPINNSYFGRINPIVFFFILLIATIALGIIIGPISNSMQSPDWFNKIMELTVGGNFWTSFITVAIFAPLCEEFLCRGIILRGLLKHISPIAAILWSAFIFAFIHLNPWQAVPAFILGVFMGWIYYKTHSLWATIFIHFVNNALASLTFHFIPNLPIDASLQDLIPNPQIYWMIFSIAIGIIALTIFIYTKYITPKDEKIISA